MAMKTFFIRIESENLNILFLKASHTFTKVIIRLLCQRYLYTFIEKNNIFDSLKAKFLQDFSENKTENSFIHFQCHNQF